MEFEDKMKRARLVRRAGLACMLGGLATFGYAAYKVSENAGPAVQKAQLEKQIFECVNAGAVYDEATQVSTMPKECYAKITEYKAFIAKPETKEALENVEFYGSSTFQYGSLGLLFFGMIVNTTGKVKERKAMMEKQQAEGEKDDEE